MLATGVLDTAGDRKAVLVSSTLFSSQTDQWSTPEPLFQRLNNEFSFTVDVCADSSNAKVARYFDLATNGLAQSWSNDVWWCNPPYGRSISDWTKKAATSEATGVMLLPARTDTRWFHEDVLPFAQELRFIRGRLYFGGAPSAAPFPSVLAIYRARRQSAVMTTIELTDEQRGVPHARSHREE